MTKPVLIALLAVAALGKQNIVLIVVDDLGQQDLGCYGSSFYETPEIDALAQEGARFVRAYSAHPRCVPSRAGLLSGKYPARFGQPGAPDRSLGPHALPLRELSFGEAFQEAGYRTAYLGKWHLGKAGGGPENQGFEISIGAGHIGAPQSYFAPYLSEKGAHGDAGAPPNMKPGAKGSYLTDRLTDEAIGCLDRFQKDPFLLVLSHYAVHTPIQAPAAEFAIYQQKAAALPALKEAFVADKTGSCKQRQDHPVYAAMVAAVDRSVGRIRKALKARKLARNTVVILTSDHGGLSSRGLTSGREVATSNLPFRHGKGWLYEGGIRVPLLIHAPGKPPRVAHSITTGTDLYPTMLELAGLPLRPEQHLDGVSVVLALDAQMPYRGPIFWHSPLGRPDSTGDTNATALRQGRWKLIEWYDENVVELYDLHEDPGEQKNLAESDPERSAALLKKLQTWREANARNAKLAAKKPQKKGKKASRILPPHQ
jgi:arylsulfatase A-like enzyme